MAYLFGQPRINKWHPYVAFKDAFTPEECDRIIQLGADFHDAQVGAGEVLPEARRSRVAWLLWKQENDWIFEKMHNVITDVRLHWYPFHLSGFTEGMQITQYDESYLGHYDMHADLGDDSMSTRKLSLCMQLNKSEEFEGGKFEITRDSPVSEMAQGSIIVFPSWTLHRVTPVTKGTRWSLVAWAHGPLFC